MHSYVECRQVIGCVVRRLNTAACVRRGGGNGTALAKKWANDLSSLLDRVEGANRGIRVRHLSSSDFFLSDECDHRVNLTNANTQLGIARLKTMVRQLLFNICKLENSLLTDADRVDLPSRIGNISYPLWYGSVY